MAQSALPRGLDLRVRGADRRTERLDVVGTVVALAVDEERRRARDPAEVGADSTSCATRVSWSRPRRSSWKRSVSRPSSRRTAPGRAAQLVLVGEQQVVHLPERALGGRGLRRLGGELRVGVHVGQRQVPPHVAEVGVGQQFAHDRLGLAAVGALEVAVLDDRDRGVGGPRTWSRLVVDPGTRSGSASASPSSARAAGWRQQRGDRKTSQVSRRRDDAPPAHPHFASSSSRPVEGRAAISSDTVKPMPAIVPLPSTATQPTGGRTARG